VNRDSTRLFHDLIAHGSTWSCPTGHDDFLMTICEQSPAARVSLIAQTLRILICYGRIDVKCMSPDLRASVHTRRRTENEPVP